MDDGVYEKKRKEIEETKMKRFALLSAIGVFGLLAATQVNAGTTGKVTLQASIIEGSLTFSVANNPSLGKIAITNGADWIANSSGMTDLANLKNVTNFGGFHDGEIKVKSTIPDVTYTLKLTGTPDNIAGNGVITAWVDSHALTTSPSADLDMDGNEDTRAIGMVADAGVGTYNKYDSTGYVTIAAELK